MLIINFTNALTAAHHLRSRHQDIVLINFTPIERTICINEGQITLLEPQYEGYLNIFTGGQVNITGPVGVCRNGSHGTVCDTNWDANDAAVFCRSLIPRKT